MSTIEINQDIYPFIHKYHDIVGDSTQKGSQNLLINCEERERRNSSLEIEVKEDIDLNKNRENPKSNPDSKTMIEERT